MYRGERPVAMVCVWWVGVARMLVVPLANSEPTWPWPLPLILALTGTRQLLEDSFEMAFDCLGLNMGHGSTRGLSHRISTQPLAAPARPRRTWSPWPQYDCALS